MEIPYPYCYIGWGNSITCCSTTSLDLAADNKQSITVLLRKCLILAYELKNERLKAWATKELNGFEGIADAELPDYRLIAAQAVGFLNGPYGSQWNHWPIPPAILEEKHKHFAMDVRLTQAISAYEDLVNSATPQGTITMDWPSNLVLYYQRRIPNNKGMVLNRAYQEIQKSSLVEMIETVRSRVLTMALDIKAEIGGTDEDHLREMTPQAQQKVNRTVVNVYRGNVNIADGESAINTTVTTTELRSSPASSEKRWWEVWWGQSIILIITGVIVGLIIWAVTRHYDKPTPSTLIEQPKVQLQTQPPQSESKAQESTRPQSTPQRSGTEKKVKIEQRGGGNGAVGGGITTGPCSNIQVGGNGNQGSVNCEIVRSLTTQEKSQFIDDLKRAPPGVATVWAVETGQSLGTDIYDALHAAGWQMQESEVQMMFLGKPMREDIDVFVHGESGDTGPFSVSDPTVVTLMRSLNALRRFKTSLGRSVNVAKGVVKVSVGPPLPTD